MKNSIHTLKRMLKYLKPMKIRLLFVLITTLCSIGLYTYTPILIGKMIDGIYNEFTNPQFAHLNLFDRTLMVSKTPMISFLITNIISCLFTFIQSYLMASVSENVTFAVEKEINKKINRLPLSYFDHHERGELLSRITMDIDKMSQMFKSDAINFINAILNISFSIIFMYTLNAFMATIIVISITLIIFLSFKVSNKTYNYARQSQTAIGELNAQVEEIYSESLIVTTYNMQKDVVDKLGIANDKQSSILEKFEFVHFAVYPMMKFATQGLFVIIALVGSLFAIQGRISLGTTQMFLQYVNATGEPLTSLSYFLNTIGSSLAGAQRIFEILDEQEEEKERENPISVIDGKGHVTFNNVYFSYDKNVELMKNVNLDIAPNEMVAIVGPTGAGKTTLVNLLMRFYEIDKGEIYIDGVNTRDMSKSKLRSMIGMVLQDTWLFKGTIAENIAFSKKDATREEIIYVCKKAKCHDFIINLEHGYDTVISSDISDLSIGQQQLLTIARAMLHNPLLLILDEATSSVDTKTEVEIQEAMKIVMENKTSFVIAHRLSTIRNANIILVMKDGEIIEKGDHKSLMSEDSYYRDLYNSQFTNEVV